MVIGFACFAFGVQQIPPSVHKSATTKTSKPPKNDEIPHNDNDNQAIENIFFILLKKVKLFFVERSYSTLF